MRCARNTCAARLPSASLTSSGCPLVISRSWRTDMQPRFVTIVVPALDEADTIEAVVRKLKPSDGDFDGWEIIVADGGSTDGTVQIVERLAAEDGRVRLLANPGRIQAIGVNLAAEAADS